MEPSKTGTGSSAATGTSAPAPAAGSGAAAGGSANAVIASSVSFREGPTTSSNRMRYLKKGEQVEIIALSSKSWYQVKDSTGKAGYVSSDTKYITVTGTLPAAGSFDGANSGNTSGTGNGANPIPTGVTGTNDNASSTGSSSGVTGVVQTDNSGGGAVEPAPSTNTGSADTVSYDVESMIAAGLKYLGTPYEYGSSRQDTRTFDCSDFVRQAFLDGLGISLPADSRGQGQYVRDKGNINYDWHQLKRGDLMFFGDYIGNKPDDYSGIDADKAIITHVAIYLGDGILLHTYSKASGGVKVTENIEDTHWDYRFLYGGSAL
ncbi:hypothetical protein VN24_04385 [Paenibacillus beijingensis]|uniref:Uncharacterized protein n=1 Tax=Paenibacillus beijingensis TaxID=1126833 RepID=A0A0D5NQN3_9BACL|nr:hypothetical protein VN24_04385 [Paenibacillus beijingensis]